MSQGGIFGIGTSALQTYQRALQVTGHNIANVGTEGYSRQRLDLNARQPEYLGFGALGTGVASSGVSRVVDDYVQARLNTSTSAESYERTLLDYSRQLDNLLADPQTGLAPALQQFYGAAQDLASDPTSTTARQQLISQGQALVDRFAQLEARISDQQVLANRRIETTVAEINQLTAGIAELNRQIVVAQGRMAGRPPNDLLDRRDEMVRQLSERVAINTVSQQDGSINVYAGRGQALVMGIESTRLHAQPLGGDPQRLEVGFNNGSTMVVISDYLSGGQLGALLELRDSMLQNASTSLGRIALAVTESFNDVHRSNMDLSGLPGGDFFARPAPVVLGSEGNSVSGRPELSVEDVAGLDASDYDMRFDGTQWTVRRLRDGQTMGTLAAGGTLQFDGLRLDSAPLSGAAAGDRLLLRPMQVAAHLAVRVTDPREVAAALPVMAEPAASNGGSLQVHGLSIQDSGHPALRAGVQVQFSGGAFTIDGDAFPADPSGETVIQYNGWELVLRGTPAEGDVIDVRDNAGGVGDNRGALALAALADQRLLTGGSETFSAGYARLVTDVAVATQRAEINADVQSRVLADARAQRENVSGVNLDEEAANLLRYQQAYQAAAQVIATANSMFDTLLSALRR